MNDRTYSHDEIVDFIETAFKPLRCVVETWDYNQKLRFRVFGEDHQPIISMPSVVLRNIQGHSAIVALVNEARVRVEGKGHKLLPR